MGRLLGVVLAGGQARRFGSDKALALLGGRPLLAHAVAALAPQTDAVVLCGRADTEVDGRRVTGLADRPAPGLGPLGGLNAALHHALAHGFDAVLTCGCDTPSLPATLATELAAAGTCAVVEALPVIGRWPATLAYALDRHLAASGDRSLRGWARAAGAALVTLPAALPNINTPGDLAGLVGR